MKRNPVIGYVASKSRTEVLCEGPSCLVVGSKEKMRTLLSMRGLRPADFTITNARFEHILAGLQYGGEYGFDEDAYKRFAPSAEEVGISRIEFDFTPSEPGKVKFLHIKTNE
jgi:hypothetical protein